MRREDSNLDLVIPDRTLNLVIRASYPTERDGAPWPGASEMREAGSVQATGPGKASIEAGDIASRA